MELCFAFNRSSEKPLFQQLYDYIRHELVEGRIKEGERLPSIRKTANSIGISRTTVENAYFQLLSEGYIESKPQKGYYAQHVEYHRIPEESEPPQEKLTKGPSKNGCYDFKHDRGEKDFFLIDEWRKSINHVLTGMPELLNEMSDISGETVLKDQICSYIYRTRNVAVSSEQIVIGAGIQPLLGMLCQIFKEVNITRCLFEEPGYNRAKTVFKQNQMALEPFNIDKLNNEEQQACYVSPSRQFPTGSIMPIKSRMKLIGWLEKTRGYLIEDDFNGELHYQGNPVPALFSLDPFGRTVYLGSFSSLLLPSIRLSYMILPFDLLEVFGKIKYDYSQTASKLEQLALVTFLKEGYFEKQIRKIKRHYSRKREVVINELNNLLTKYIIESTDGGYYVTLRLFDLPMDRLMEDLKDKGVLLNEQSQYYFDEHSKIEFITINYRGIGLKEMMEGLKILVGTINALSKK